MMIKQLTASDAEAACRAITATLPEWFGIPEANERYAKGVKERAAFGFISEGECQGLIVIEKPFPHTAVIYWMGVKKEALNKGIGKSLLYFAEQYCLDEGIYNLTVETLSPKENDPNYLKTFQFYRSAGFQPLFELNTYGPDFAMVYLHKVLSPKLFNWIDLTHTLHKDIPTWDCSCGFEHKTLLHYDDCPDETKFLIQRIEMRAGLGTHMDAPLHCFPGTNSVADIPLEKLLTHCLKIDVSSQANETYLVSLSDIKQFEAAHGSRWKNALVIFYTGWDRYWSTPDKYHNQYRFPAISQEAAEYLLSQDINGIGIDTLSPDRPESGFPVHRILLGADKYIIENVANASQMPAVGGFTLAMPLKIAGGTEAPLRLLGLI